MYAIGYHAQIWVLYLRRKGFPDSLYVVIDDGACLVPQPDRLECQMRVSRYRGWYFPSFQEVAQPLVGDRRSQDGGGSASNL